MTQSSLFTEIAIIESLESKETHTGKILCEYLIGLEETENLSVLYKKCDTKSQFIQLLTVLFDRVKNEGSFPLLHIECHGCEAGIVLASGELVTWEEFKPVLTDINVATQCNLMVVMATCHGALLGKILKPTERAPCWGVLGPTEEVNVSDLMGTYRSFYFTLLSNRDGDAALKALFASDVRESGYFFMSALGLFKSAYSGYLADECTYTAYWNRSKRLQKELIKKRVRKSRQDIVLDLKSTEKDSFEKFKYNFFMYDLYPENQKRFQLDYSEIKPQND
jgi:hypothetical protein